MHIWVKNQVHLFLRICECIYVRILLKQNRAKVRDTLWSEWRVWLVFFLTYKNTLLCPPKSSHSVCAAPISLEKKCNGTTSRQNKLWKTKSDITKSDHKWSPGTHGPPKTDDWRQRNNIRAWIFPLIALCCVISGLKAKIGNYLLRVTQFFVKAEWRSHCWWQGASWNACG